MTEEIGQPAAPQGRAAHDAAEGNGPQSSGARIAELLEQELDVPELAEAVERQRAADAADTLEHLEDEEAADVLVAMDEQAAADALAEMEGPLAAGVIQDLLDEGRADYAGLLLRTMAPDDAADLLQELDEATRESLLRSMPAEHSEPLRKLLVYDEETAGGLMTTQFISLREDLTVAQAIERIRRGSIPEELHHLPVTDRRGRLRGIVSLHALLLSPPERLVADLTDRTVKTLRPDFDQEAVAREFDRYDLFMLPVTDETGHLLGVVTVDDVIDIIRAEQTEDVQKSVGAGAQEAVYSSILEKFQGRSRWLFVALVIMVPATLIVFAFSESISRHPILAVLMPLVAALAGNAGHQALAVTLRGIVLGEVRRSHVWPLLRREAVAGLLNGLFLGSIVGLANIALGQVFDTGGWRIGVVVCLSMTGSMCIGSLVGAAIPIVMQRFGSDPARSSAIFLIMCTDFAAFFTFLGLASWAAEWLAPAAV